MNEISTIISDLGIPGAMFVFLIYQTFFLTKKVVSIVENNTKALTKVEESVKECHRLHSGAR